MKVANVLLVCSFLLVVLVSYCGKKKASSNVEAPGDGQTAMDKTLETGADLLQDKTPLRAFNAYLDGFHFYNGNIQAQMEAHHYVAQLNEDMYQAIIFDGNEKDAKIMGVEYIITEQLFRQLPKEEKALWHSHHFEVKSGTLVAPGIPELAEHKLMEKLVATYGKTIHTWHTDQERTLPIGSPMIMMGFTKEGQLQPRLLEERDKRLGISSSKKKENRKDIPMPKVDPEANAWEKGTIRQFTLSDKADSSKHKH